MIRSRGLLLIPRRSISGSAIKFDAVKDFRIAIVGSGPAGFYTAHHLLNKAPSKVGLNIDFYDRLPAPFGLSRYGVAPDHPEVKNCEEYLENIMEKYGKDDSIQHKVRFYGNLNVGKDISLKDLEKHYHSVVLSYGSTTEDNQLDVPGADLPGVVSARQFVNWYNGHPDFYQKGSKKFVPPPLDQIEDVTIVGNGNVALDIARILLADPSHWSPTDISVEALEVLKTSKVKNVNIVARRGLLESAFSNKEIRELFELSRDKVKFIPVEEHLLDSVDKKSLGRVDKRKVGLIEKYSVPSENTTAEKTWSLKYLKSPIEFLPNSKNPALLSSTRVRINELVDDEGRTRVKGTDKTETLKNELVILSIGYKGSPLKQFDELDILFERNRLLNKDGRILQRSEAGQIIKKGWYTSGWIKNGPTGVIATTMMDSFDTADRILQDLELDIHLNPAEPPKVPDGVVSWKNWQTLDDYEKSKGADMGKTRFKVCNSEDMISIACK